MIKTVTVCGHDYGLGDTWLCSLNGLGVYITFKATSMVISTENGTEELYYCNADVDMNPLHKMESYEHPDFNFASGVVYNINGNEVITGCFVTVDGKVIPREEFSTMRIDTGNIKVVT